MKMAATKGKQEGPVQRSVLTHTKTAQSEFTGRYLNQLKRHGCTKPDLIRFGKPRWNKRRTCMDQTAGRHRQQRVEGG